MNALEWGDNSRPHQIDGDEGEQGYACRDPNFMSLKDRFSMFLAGFRVNQNAGCEEHRAHQEKA